MKFDFDLKCFIALLLLQKVEKFRDSYTLTRVLEWKFKIIETLDVLRNLENKKLITSHERKLLHHYEITPEGAAYVEKNWQIGIDKMHARYPLEEDFIAALIK